MILPGPRVRASIVLAIAIAALWPTAHSQRNRRSFQPILQSRAASVPPALLASLPHQGRDLVLIVAADIDADGDLDVIASDANLDLFVWVNDGQGHLSRRPSRRSTSLQPQTLPPAVQNGPFGSHPSIAGSPLLIDVALRPVGDPLAPGRAPGRAAPSRATADALLTRTPRGPPRPLSASFV